jgi:pimeloyl-ACP methyl ester carboxylesterase
MSRVVVPDAGYDVHLEQPDAWIAVLRDFLADRLSGG